jgi:hypothetical protein
MFFTGGLGGYLELYKHTVDALEKAAANLNTEIMVGGPALSWWDPGWMQPFLAFVAQNKLPINFLSWHWYADDPSVGQALGYSKQEATGFKPLAPRSTQTILCKQTI